MSFRRVSPEQLAGIGRDGVLYCVGSRALDRVLDGRRPIVVVTSGASIPDAALERLSMASVVVIPLTRLTAATLFRALLQSMFGVADFDPVAQVLEEPAFGRVPRCAVEALLLHGARIGRPKDLCKRLGWTRGRLSAVTHEAGFERSEYLIAALRAEMCYVLFGRDLAPAAVEAQLGVFHRPTFRRSCYRAGIMPPWERENVWGSGGA